MADFTPSVGMVCNDMHLHGIGHMDNVSERGEIVYADCDGFLAKSKESKAAVWIPRGKYWLLNKNDFFNLNEDNDG